jgi:hypothetical protein
MGIHRGPNIVRDGLVLYLDAGNYKSYPQIGNTICDLSGCGNTTIITDECWCSDNGGGIVSTSGSSTCIVTPTTEATAFTPTDCFSISAWFQMTNVPYACFGEDIYDGTTSVFGQGTTKCSVGIGFISCYNDGNYGIYLGSRAVNTIGIVVTAELNRIYNAVLVYTPTYQYYYVNGVPISCSNTSSGIGGCFEQQGWATFARRAVPSGNGVHGCGYFYMGALHNIPLSADDVQQNYNANKSRFGL